MAERRQSEPRRTVRRVRTASTPEGRENQLISMAADLAERQMREGTASAQVITHFLKLGSTRERLEQQKMRYETQLLQAKKEHMDSTVRQEELYKEALRAMSDYNGTERPVFDDDDEYDDGR